METRSRLPILEALLEALHRGFLRHSRVTSLSPAGLGRLGESANPVAAYLHLSQLLKTRFQNGRNPRTMLSGYPQLFMVGIMPTNLHLPGL